MTPKKIKLTKSQQSLFKAWTEDYGRIMNIVGGMLQDNLNLRLEKLAQELGLDLDTGDYGFDQRTMEFFVKEPGKPGPSFPGEPEADYVDVPVGEPEVSDAIDTEKKEG